MIAPAPRTGRELLHEGYGRNYAGSSRSRRSTTRRTSSASRRTSSRAADRVTARPRVAEADPAEVECGGDDAVPERPQVRDDPQLDLGFGVAREQVFELDDLDRLDGRARDPVAACLGIRLERLLGEPVGDEARVAEARQPRALDSVDAAGLAVEQRLDVLVARRVVRPEGRAGAVAREPSRPERG